MTDRELMEHVANLLADWPTEGTRAVMSAHFLLRERLKQFEPYDQTALELCDVCGWKAQILGDVCVMCKWKKQPAAEVEEGCTPADARKLREANHALAQENHELRERLAQPDPEPVKFLANGARYKVTHLSDVGFCIPGLPKDMNGRWVALVAAEDGRHRQLTAPPRREWHGLSEPDLHELNPTWPNPGETWEYENVLAFARAIEVALREKNT